MKRMLLLAAPLILLLGCGTTIRTSSQAFRTGRVLEPGEYRVATETSTLGFLPYPLVHYSAARGFPGGWEVELAGGLHGFLVDDADSDSSDLITGPEIFVTKNLVSQGDLFYASVTAGVEVDVVPYTEWTGHAGMNLGFYPAGHLVIFGHAKAVTIGGAGAIPVVGAGIGWDGPFVFKLGAYLAPFEQVETVDPNGRPTALWPFYYGVQLGGTFP